MANKPTQLLNRTEHRAPERRWASMKQAADYAGVKSEHTIRDWIAKSVITGYRVNARVIRVDLNEIDAAMQPFGGGA